MTATPSIPSRSTSPSPKKSKEAIANGAYSKGQFLNLKIISYLPIKMTENTLHSLSFFDYFGVLSLLVAIFSFLI